MTELELLGDGLIARGVRAVQVIQQAAALADHHEETTAGAVVLGVLLQVLGEFVDTLGEQGNLHVSRACVLLVETEIVDQFRFRFFNRFFNFSGAHLFLLIKAQSVEARRDGCKALFQRRTAGDLRQKFCYPGWVGWFV